METNSYTIRHILEPFVNICYMLSREVVGSVQWEMQTKRPSAVVGVCIAEMCTYISGEVRARLLSRECSDAVPGLTLRHKPGFIESMLLSSQYNPLKVGSDDGPYFYTVYSNTQSYVLRVSVCLTVCMCVSVCAREISSQLKQLEVERPRFIRFALEISL